MIATPVRARYADFPTESDQPGYTTHNSPNNQGLYLPPTLGPRIVIPQRRPGSKERGFVLAYPPALDVYGIPQSVFLEFLQGCNKAVQGHAALTAVGAIGFGVGVAPEPISMLVGAAVQFGASALNKNVATWKTNSYIDKCNKELFFPRGLMCIISIHDPEAAAGMGVHQAMASNLPEAPASISFGGNYGSDPRVISPRGNGFGATEDVAPLVYLTDPETTPAQDAGATDKAKMSHRVKNVYSNINNYLDKRSRATYAKENPNDFLTSVQPPTEYTSRSSVFNPPHRNLHRSAEYQVSGKGSEQRGESERRIKKDILYLTIIQAPDQSRFQRGF